MTSFSLLKKIEFRLRKILTLQGLANQIKRIPLKLFLVNISQQNFTQSIKYKSPLCLQIAKNLDKSPDTVAENVLDLWTNFNHICPSDIQIIISGNGWLEFTINDCFLSNWLQELPNFNLPPQSFYLSPNQLNFSLYYAHLRCCSLLRLAQEEKLIQLKSTNFSQGIWQWHQPKLIPYNCGCLKLKSEKKLIIQLMSIVDTISSQKEANWLKIGDDFSKIILDFEGYCRIFGDLKTKNLELAQARLGLVALSQLYLHWILTQKLQAIAPTEW